MPEDSEILPPLDDISAPTSADDPVVRPPQIRRPRTPWWTTRDAEFTFSRTTLLAVLAAGIVGAIFWRIDELGIGVTITGLTALAVVLATAPVNFRQRMYPYWIVIAVGITGLLLVPTFRAASWVGALCIAAAVVGGAALFVESRGLRGLFLAVMSIPFAPLLGLVAAFRRRPAPQSRRFDRRRVGLAIVVTAATLGLLLIFGALLASADSAFGSLFNLDLANPISPNLISALVAGLVIALFTLGGAYLTTQGTDYPDQTRRERPPIWVWAVPVGAVLAMFLVFLGVQAATLFGGDTFVQKTANLTYSEYARQGFWQLLVVSILVLLTAMTAWHFVDADDRRALLAARCLLGGLLVATLAIGASAIHRMERYINAYGMTEERLFGIVAELFVAAVIVGFLVVGVRARSDGLSRTLVAVGVFTMLAFAIANPDRFIASYNVDRFDSTGKVDAWYLGSLSADAVHEFDRLPATERRCAQWRYGRYHSDDSSWRQFNVSRQRAKSFNTEDRGPTPSCATASS